MLSSTCISEEDLALSERLLNEFVEEFELLYGQENMVYNVHLLLHLSEMVRKNGPLFCYSNYNMEDNMGHLIRSVHGTNDVLNQVCSKYLMEKKLLHNLSISPTARQYYSNIQPKKMFSTAKKIANSHIIGIEVIGLSKH